MSFTNLYYKRTTGTPKACWICYKPTTTVLATIKTVDFFYTCDTHLSDRGFATSVSESTSGARKPSPEEVAKVKEEWDEKQDRKRKSEEEKEKEQAEKDGDSEKQKDKESSPKAPKPPGSLPSPSPSTPPAGHQRFTLHRDLFSMRLSEHRKERQTAQANALAPRLPGAPTGSVI
ncbi:hypothetical protein D9757_000288 [Collybiopsis confluens]|uniref:DUF1742-domain-containing protein n=1 Tax=Collybiopsis confluens TaxID=2823264 RepID=A0A8H5I352_9AGAR|nr:hypothetical protein D9757_000288 [Collybiopsis confluens]